MPAEIKINRIKAQNKNSMTILDDTLHSEELLARVPRLAEVNEARIEYRNKINTFRELKKHQNDNLHYVANIDVSVWNAVLETFAQYDPNTGDLMDDGLLYKFDEEKGCLVLNRDFFYALLSGPLRDYDMRGKSKIIV